MGMKKVGKVLVFIGAAAALAASIINDKKNNYEESENTVNNEGN